MKKFKLKGQQLIFKHNIAILNQAIKCPHPGNFVGKGIKMRWVVWEGKNGSQ